MANLAEMEEALTEHFVARPSAEWLARLDAAGVPAGPVNTINQMHEDPQTLARQMVVEVEHTTLGKVKTLGLPIKLSETPGRPTRGAPLYGEHTREVLREQGYDEEAIARLIDDGSVVAVEENGSAW